MPLDAVNCEDIFNNRQKIGDSDDTLLWPNIAQREQDLFGDEFTVEPKETDEIWSDFLLKPGIKLLQVYARINYKNDADGYWGAVKLIEL